MVDIERLERVLVQAARERRPVSYSQLLQYFGRKVTPVMVRALCRDLGRVEERRRDQGLPELACLVVRKADGFPGDGYFISHAKEGNYRGLPGGDAAVSFLRDQQARAFTWAAQQPPGLDSDSPPQ